MRIRDLFATIRTEGALLPAELLQRVLAEDKDLPGLTPVAYHLGKHEKLNEAVSRSWTRLRGAWQGFRSELGRYDEHNPGTGPTRERWLSILFQELGYGHLLKPPQTLVVDQKEYPISHLWGRTPIHLVGVGLGLDARVKGAAGASKASPHSLVQEFLNRSDDHLWAFLSNGRLLRVLRDNVSMTRQAYVDFDLVAMMEGEAYSDFKLLWLVCHQSRVEAERPEECWLEKWSRQSAQDGARALDALRGGVQSAIEALGRGFLQHGANARLRARLEEGELTAQDYYRQLLRQVYRLLFLFVAEDRDLLLDPEASLAARERFLRHYSTARLRELAQRRKGTRHGDLWQGLGVLTALLGADDGCPGLGLYPLGSHLWSVEATPDLSASQLSNHDLLQALRLLAFRVVNRTLRRVDYKNLGPEELGSVYESLLELTPTVDLSARTFSLLGGAGNERKTTGSYYTPPELVQTLLDSALEPVVEDRLRQAGRDREAAILSLKVCDPAVGSGHFLLAAAHRLARHLARERTGDEEPAPAQMRRALRDVISHCLYGVDVNEMAAELCKVSLWIECLEPTRPLSFLENRILVGNSLLGTTPFLLEAGLPDEAFVALGGDDKKQVAALKKANKEAQGRHVEGDLFASGGPEGGFESAARALEALPDASIAELHRKEDAFAALLASEARLREKRACDAWCAAFVIEKRPGVPGITRQTVARMRAGEPTDLEQRVEELARKYAFFHWHLAFPTVFRAEPGLEAPGWSGGFDVVLGNPPWERMKIQEKEWFASRSQFVAEAGTAAERGRRIAALRTENPALFEAFQADLRRSEGESHFLHNSARYPLCGRGDINTYAVFAETNRMLMGARGRTGFIVPPGIATDHTTQFFFCDLAEKRQLVSLYTFENEERLFPGIDHRVNFTLLCLTGSQAPVAAADFVWYARRAEHLADPGRHFTLSLEDLSRLNPNTRTCPIFRSRRDADLNLAIYGRVPVLWREGPPEANPWGLKLMAMLHMANDSGLFREAAALEADGLRLVGNRFERGETVYLPLYEAKMLHHFDHRFGTYQGQTEAQARMSKLPEATPAQHADPCFVVLPRYWVPGAEVDARLSGRTERGWLLGWRDITNTTNERTVIASLLPRVGVGDKFLLMIPNQPAHLTACLMANLNSFMLDYCARQKVGGTSLKYYLIKQLPVLPPETYARPCPWSPGQTLAEWLLPRVLELTYTAHDLEPFARDVGFTGPPFRWDSERRFTLRAELDAAFFHLYGLSREDAEFVMETFPITRRADEKEHGSYRTRDRILECYDRFRVGAVAP